MIFEVSYTEQYYFRNSVTNQPAYITEIILQ